MNKMRKYYVHYYRDFANTYNLYYADADHEVPESWVRITRKTAEELARRERRARKNDPGFSGYADTAIFPAGCEDIDFVNDRRYELIGCIWERVR